MKAIIRGSILLLLLSGTLHRSPAQITFQFGAGAGLAVPTSDYAGTTSDFYNGAKYGMGKGLNFHAKVRFGLLGLKLAGEAGYSSLSNSGDATTGGGTVDVSQKVLSFKLGPEFSFGIPLAPISPYFGINASINQFNGTIEFQGVPKVAGGTYDLKTASRIGFGFTGGVVFTLGSFTGLDISAAYDFLNSSGKAWQDSHPAQDQRLDSYLSLNDVKDPLYKAGDEMHFINNSRSMSLLTIRATFMIGF